MNEPNERKRRHFSDDQKATIVRRHLGDKVPVSAIKSWRKLARDDNKNGPPRKRLLEPTGRTTTTNGLSGG